MDLPVYTLVADDTARQGFYVKHTVDVHMRRSVPRDVYLPTAYLVHDPVSASLSFRGIVQADVLGLFGKGEVERWRE